MTSRPKSRQYCSVCKDWLDMEVVPTGDGDDDDGVIWFRCPQCQGFLPKLGGADLQGDAQDGDQADPPADASQDEKATEETAAVPTTEDADPATGELPWDSPADMMAAREKGGDEAVLPDLDEMADQVRQDAEVPDETTAGKPGKAAEADEPPEPAEPIHEYAALLAEREGDEPLPYRPWETYEVGQCILHQAWEDCGVVVAKEKLPGGRQVIKCYFEEAGVVRLIEQAPR